jgi:hypothetical protein
VKGVVIDSPLANLENSIKNFVNANFGSNIKIPDVLIYSAISILSDKV